MNEYFNVSRDRITIIANGVDPEKWQTLPPSAALSELKIIMPARFDLSQKDPLTLIRAVVKLLQEGKSVKLTLLGSGADEQRIRDEIASHNASQSIQLIEHSGDVPSLLAKHNVLCLSTKFEGLPTVVIEGMLGRRLVVASRVAGCVDIIRDGSNGFLFKAGSVDDCAAKLGSLFSLRNAEDIRDRAFQDAINTYTPQAMIARFRSVLAD